MNSTILPVSILIPTLNRPKALRDTICSFISLAKKPHEIIIVDQSDSDETEFVINEFSTRETDIVFKYVQLSVKSSTMARNIAMSNATNNICIFCDDDIEVPPNVIEKVYVRMLTPSTTMIAGIDYRTFGMQDTNTRISRMFNSVFLFTDNKKTNSGYVTGSMLGCFPRSITGVVSTEWAMGFFFAIKLSKRMGN